MFKGYRGPLAALVMAFVLLGMVIATRPSGEVRVTSIPATAKPTVLPTLTPAPTIPIQQVDTTTLHEGIIGCVKKLNPLLAAYNQADRDITSLIFEGLMTTDSYGAAVPALAAAQPQVSSDGLTYIISLRTDVLWQDGVHFTSNDVLFTIHLIQDANFPGQTDLHNFWSTVEVDAIDDHTVRFRLAQPLAAFTDYLRVGLVPEHALKGSPAAALMTNPFNLAPIGTGPYQFDKLIGDGNQLTGVQLRFSATYSQRPEGKDGFAFRQIIFHCEPTATDAVAAFQRGEVNSLGELPPELVAQVSGLNNLAQYNANRPAFGAVIYNWQRESVSYFRDLRMRSALAQSVDRVKLVNQYLPYRAVPADSPILPLSWAYNPNTNCPAYNMDQAKADLARVQIAPPSSATQSATQAATQAATAAAAAPVVPSNYKFQLLVSNDVALSGLAGEIVNSWNALGLQVVPVVVDPETFKQRLVAGDFDAALVELNLAPGADPDPYSLWRQDPKNGGLNFGGLNERQISEVVESARKESVNNVNRAKLYQEFQQIFCERAAALLLYYPIYTYAVDRRIDGIQLGFMSSPSDRFRTIKNWHFGS